MAIEDVKGMIRERSYYCKEHGIFVEELGNGYSRVAKLIEKRDLNPLGYAHGGVYFAMADTACGTLAATHGCVCVTLNATYNFMRSAVEGDTVYAEAKEVKVGKTVRVYDATITDQNGTLLGTGTFTFFATDKTPQDLLK